MDNTPDRQPDPDDFGYYIECKDCGDDVLESEHLAFRCKSCFRKLAQKERGDALNHTLKDIGSMQ